MSYTEILGDWLDIAHTIPDNSVDLILADLPYGETANKRDVIIPFDFLWKHYWRILKPKGNILLHAQGKFMMKLANSQFKYYRYDIVWNKVLLSNALNAKRMPLRQHEQILVFWKKKGAYNPQMSTGKKLHSKGKSYLNKTLTNNNYGKIKAVADARAGTRQKYPTTIWTFAKPHPSVSKHRTEKPVALLERLIQTYSNPGDIILDNTAGSGPIVAACISTGRSYIVVEKDPKEFVKIIARKKIALEQQTQTTIGLNDNG